MTLVQSGNEGKLMLIQITRARLFPFAAPVAAAIALVTQGCGGGSSDSNTHCRFVNTVYNTQASVTVAGQPLNINSQTNLPFGGATFYNNVPNGTDTIAFNLTNWSGPLPFASLSEGLNTGIYYTDFVMGRQDITDPTNPRFPVQIFATDDRTTPGTGNARMRIVDAAPDAGTIDVRVNGNPIVAAIGYQYISGMGEFGAGTESIVIDKTGTTTPILSQAITLNAGEFYTLIILETTPTTTPGYSILVTNDSIS
jgi:hypothetical protein